MLSTDQKGNIAEAAIALAATRLHIDVYRPLGEGGRYDLILEVGEQLLRVQCKWAARQGDVIAVAATRRDGPLAESSSLVGTTPARSMRLRRIARSSIAFFCCRRSSGRTGGSSS